MYRALSPIFDVPEFPPLRRVKPLPKRRRTSDSPTLDDAGHPAAASPMLDPPDELIARTDALSAQRALQSYYMPVLGGVQELFRSDLASGASTPVDLGGSAYGVRDDGGADDGDYIDHLQQPGNTKKRKVPAHVSGAAHGHDADGGSGAEDEPAERGCPTGARAERDGDGGSEPSPGLAQRRGQLPRATLAGLQHKKMLRARKRQLAAVLGALSHGDTLALDQALSASYPFAGAGAGDLRAAPPAKVRLSRRRGARLARALRALRASLPPRTDERAAVALPPAGFSFVCHSATSERLIATREEVAVLHSRFEAELARQTAKAAEAAKQAAAANGPFAKRADRGKQGAGAPGANAASLEQSLLGTKAGGKKKKRSALANASNPHHLRNYVPSRLPNTGPNAQANATTQNLLGPLPLRFLSAEMPPRRRKKSERVATPVSTLTSPAEEWICPFCEYGLFYGDEVGFQRGMRSRKKILRRRRRARERAAAAASGVGEKSTPVKEDAGGGLEAAARGAGPAAGKQTRWKDETERGGRALG